MTVHTQLPGQNQLAQVGNHAIVWVKQQSTLHSIQMVDSKELCVIKSPCAVWATWKRTWFWFSLPTLQAWQRSLLASFPWQFPNSSWKTRWWILFWPDSLLPIDIHAEALFFSFLTQETHRLLSHNQSCLWLEHLQQPLESILFGVLIPMKVIWCFT